MDASGRSHRPTGRRAGRLLAAAALCGATSAWSASCESLSLSFGVAGTTVSAGTTVTAATTIPGTAFTAPDGQTYSGLPAFCKVSVVLTPTSDSFINVELWLPTTTWNGRFQGVGNGGYAGTIAVSVPAMLAGLQAGFAVASTDMGTAPSSNNDGDALVGHPEKWTDFGHRATHLMTAAAKDIMQGYYGKGPQYSYFNGCSTGGEQALMEAQRYPDDYDGIMGGDPASNRTHVHTAVLAEFKALRTSALSLFMSSQAQLVTSSVLAACAVSSGGLATDPFLTDPRSCNWDPGVLQCQGTNVNNCLQPDQVQAARAIYAGPHDPVNGHLIFPGAARGSESDSQFGWPGIGSQPEVPFGSLFKWALGPTFQWQSYDFDRAMAKVDSTLAADLNANSADLSRFKRRGGKLLMYHGWADPLIAPQDSINYYERVVAAQGVTGSAALAQTQSFYRLFMVPGMYHCAFGPGPNAFGNLFSGQVYAPAPPSHDASHDAFVALQEWVEKGIAPSRIVATKYVGDVAAAGVQMTRPICAYPKIPKYTGSGDSNDAANFACVPSTAANPPLPAPEYRN